MDKLPSRSYRILRSLAAIVAMLFLSITAAAPAFAKPTSEQQHMYSQNNILFYDPSETNCVSNSLSSSGKGDSDGSDVYVIGDSITNQSQNDIRNVMPNATINSQASIYFSHNESGLVSGVDRISQMGDQDILVFALGTNGGVDVMYQDDTEKLLAAINGRNIKVILMTIYYGGTISQGQMTSTNETVKELASQYSNISVMDWNAAASSDPSKYVSSDHIHPTAEGQVKFAEIMKEAVDKVTKMNRTSASSSDSSSGGSSSSGLTALRIEFVNKYHDIAVSLSIEYGIPWEAVMAQGIEESTAGTSNFAVERNNFFGIGAYDSNPNLAFRYETPELGWRGYYENIRKTSTYRNHGVFSGDTVTDPQAYLAAVKAAGYATDPNYIPVVGSIIRQVEAYAIERGWPLSAQIAAENPVWFENAAKYAEGGEPPADYSSSSSSSYSSQACKNSDGTGTSGGVTYAEINGRRYAFPIAGATKANVLRNTSELKSVYSEFGYVSELSAPTVWYHHTGSCTSSSCNQPNAADMGIAVRMTDMEERDAQYYVDKYDSWGEYGDNTSLPYYASSGATVVAAIGGTLEWTNEGRTYDKRFRAWCSDVKITGDDGHLWYYIHILRDDNLYSRESRRVEVGEVIGEVGTPECADDTQSHLHFMIDGSSSPIDIANYLNPLFDALPADAAELAAREAAGSGDPVFYQQSDPRWGSIPYGNCGGVTIGAAGCGPTSLASIIATMTGDKSVTPDVVAAKAAQAGYRACGAGSDHNITFLATDYGLTVKNYGQLSIEQVSEYLRQGVMFHITGAGAAPFSSNGHFIAIRGITDSGKWLIFDSSHGGTDYNTREWEPSHIYKIAVRNDSEWRGVSK